jgi:carbohydrate-binding DOMON domain-containing protein
MRPAPKVNDQAQVIEASAIEVIQEQLADLDRKIEALPVAAPAQQQLPSVAESKLAEVLTRIESLTMTVTQITQAPMIVTSDSVVSPMTVTPIAESRESEIRALLKRDPGMTYYEIAKQIGCANATAKKWKERIELNG